MLNRNLVLNAPLLCFALALWTGAASGQCIEDPDMPLNPQLDYDQVFADLDADLPASFPAWMTRYNERNTEDPSPYFRQEDNSQNGINDDDHLALLAAIIDGNPSGVILAGLPWSVVNSIRTDFAANRTKVEPGLTYTVIFVEVNIIEIIAADAPEFAEALKDLVAAYMTLGDAESTAFVRGLLITLGNIFIDLAVESGEIPDPAFPDIPQLTRDGLENAVNGNFTADQFATYGDTADASRSNLLGDSGDIDGDGQSNEAEYAAAANREDWLVNQGIPFPPLRFASFTESLTVDAGAPAQLASTLAGGSGDAVLFDWKSYTPETGAYTRVSTAATAGFDYAVPAGTGTFRLAVCDGTWVRVSPFATLTVNPRTFEITAQPQSATVQPGGSHTFSVAVTGGYAPPAYAWEFSPTPSGFSAIPGATGAALALSGISPADDGYYRAVITGADSEGAPVTLTSDAALLDVEDNPPELTLLGANPLDLECGGAYDEPGATAEDEEDGNISAAITVSGTVHPQTPGTYTLEYSVTDSAENTATATRTVVVSDATAPVLTLLGEATVQVECGGAFTDPGATATDACAGDLDPAISVSGTVNTNAPGDYTLEYAVSDTTGNTASANRTVQVRDTTPPVLTLNGAAEIGLECGAEFTDPGAAAVDACDGDAGSDIVVTGAVLSREPGEYTLTYSVSDGAGNEAQVTRTVSVQDTLPPVLTLPQGLQPGGTLAVECGEEAPALEGATAFDTCDGDVSENIAVDGAPDTSEPGAYTVAYEVADQAGNTATAQVSVVVEDTEAPVLTLNGAAEITVECGDVFNDPGASAADACAGDLTSSVQAAGSPDTGTPGAYTVNYQVSDGAGNESSAGRTVTVVDTTPPVLSLEGGLEDGARLAHPCGSPFAVPAATATDACDGGLSGVIGQSGSVDTGTPGEYTLQYTVTDTAGNTASVSVTVDVVDEESPVVTLLGSADVVLSCGGFFEDPGATATDTCAGDLSGAVQVSGAVATSEPGVYTLRYQATDGAGNTGEAVRTVTVLDDCVLEITRQPRSATVYEGAPYSFRVVIARYDDAQYDWQKDGASLGAPSADTYSIPNASAEDAGVYTCLVSRGGQSIETTPATLAVVPLPDSGGHAADTDGDWSISLGELLRVIQFYNLDALQCAPGTEDGFAPGSGDTACAPHSADYNPQNWQIELSELLRMIQFYNSLNGAFRPDAAGEDGYAPGAG